MMESFLFIGLGFLKLNCTQPGLNGALFVERSGTKKREWKTDKAALI